MESEALGLTDLPDEVLFQLLTYLDVKDIIRLSNVCKFLYRFCQDDAIWRETFAQRGQHLQSLAEDALKDEGDLFVRQPVWKHLAVGGQCAYHCGRDGPLDITPCQSAMKVRGRYSEMLLAKYGESRPLAMQSDIINGCTIECWIQIEPGRHGETLAGVILGTQSESVARNIWPHYHWQVLHIGPDGRIRGAILTYCLLKGPFVADGKWHHIALSGDYNEQCMYVDGTLVDSSDTPFGSQPHQKELRYCQLGTGCISYGYNTPYDKDAMPPGHCGRLPFKGKIRELRIWSVVLSQEYIGLHRSVPRIDLYLKWASREKFNDLAYYWPLTRLLHATEGVWTSLGSKNDYMLKALGGNSLDKETLGIAF